MPTSGRRRFIIQANNDDQHYGVGGLGHNGDLLASNVLLVRATLNYDDHDQPIPSNTYYSFSATFISDDLVDSNLNI